MQLNCAYLRGRQLLAVQLVPVGTSTTVNDLYDSVEKAATSSHSIPEGASLTLFVTKALDDATSDSCSWLQRATLPRVDAPLVEHGCDALLRGQEQLYGPLLGSGFEFHESDIHIVAIVQDSDQDSNEPPRKRACVVHRDQRAFANPPLVLDFCCVPLDTIDAFHDTQVALTLRGPKPVALIQGVLLSGKTTVLNAITKWIEATAGPDDQCFHVDLQTVDFDDEAMLWESLSCGMGPDFSCTNMASLLRALSALPETWCLIVDHMEYLLERPARAAQFLAALRAMRELPTFGGFVGVGSGDLQRLASDNRDLFRDGMVAVTKPFAVKQMRELCYRLRRRFVFRECLPNALMEYSGGSPGVFASLLELTFTTSKSPRDGPAWKQWFETEGFAEYVGYNYCMFKSLHDEWRELTGFEWRYLVDAFERRKNAADPLALPMIRGDLVDVESRLEDAAAEHTNANDSGQQHADMQVDGYTRMCRRIRIKYLGIIARISDGVVQRYPQALPL